MKIMLRLKNTTGNYALATLFVAISAFLGRILLDFFEMHAPFITFYPVVILASMLWGVGPALFATALSALIVVFLFLEPVRSFTVAAVGDFVAVTVFVVSGIILAIISHRLSAISAERAQREALQKAHDELEKRVRERTAELQQAYDQLRKETREREEAEQQLLRRQKLEALGTLASGIAHDFNNVLAGIIGFCEMVLEGMTPDSRDHGRLQLALKGAQRGQDLVRQILAFGRKSEQDKKPLALTEIVEETLKLLRPTFPSAIEIVSKSDTHEDQIFADSGQMHQVVMNLCTNAAHAMRDTGGVLEIRISETVIAEGTPTPFPAMKPGEYVVLEVSDTGCGMGPETLDQIFDPFFTTKKEGEGTGLGLSVSHGIVRSHDGYIAVESEPGKGSTFHVYLPRLKETTGTGDKMAPSPTRGNERILIVDDEDILVELNRQRLSDLGYDVVATTSSMDALNMFREEPDKFDLVITDQTMPNLTGMDLAAKLLKVKASIPIILCTGHNETIAPEKAREAGIRARLAKPFTRQELAETVRRVLDAKTHE